MRGIINKILVEWLERNKSLASLMRQLVPQGLIAASDVSHHPTIHFALTLAH